MGQGKGWATGSYWTWSKEGKMGAAAMLARCSTGNAAEPCSVCLCRASVQVPGEACARWPQAEKKAAQVVEAHAAA